jgi:hypothetical protein
MRWTWVDDTMFLQAGPLLVVAVVSVSPERLMLLLEVVRAERSCPDRDRWFPVDFPPTACRTTTCLRRR